MRSRTRGVRPLAGSEPCPSGPAADTGWTARSKPHEEQYLASPTSAPHRGQKRECPSTPVTRSLPRAAHRAPDRAAWPTEQHDVNRPLHPSWSVNSLARISTGRFLTLAASVAALVGLVPGCGGESSSSRPARNRTVPAPRNPSTPCANPTQCSTQTTGQRLSDVTISDPSNVQAVMGALREEYATQSRSAGQQTGFVLAQWLCAPVGSLGQFPQNDYMCGGVEQSTVTGQDSYSATVLFNVRADGTVYFVGSPCEESTPASGCDANYWNLVQSQAQTAAAAAAPPAPPTPSTPTTSSNNNQEGCRALDVKSGSISCKQALDIAQASINKVGPDGGGSNDPVHVSGFTCLVFPYEVDCNGSGTNFSANFGNTGQQSPSG